MGSSTVLGDVVGSEAVGNVGGDGVGSEVEGGTDGDMIGSDLVGGTGGDMMRSGVVGDTDDDTVERRHGWIRGGRRCGCSWRQLPLFCSGIFSTKLARGCSSCWDGPHFRFLAADTYRHIGHINNLAQAGICGASGAVLPRRVAQPTVHC